MRRNSGNALLAMAVLAALTLAAFAGVLARPGIVGHTWDWGVPNFADQFRDMARHHFSTWDAYFETGRYHYFKLELLYWLTLWPVSVLGGETVSKWLPLVLTFCSGAAMWPLARRQGLPPFFALLASVFYAFSPYALSRIVAGHMPMLVGYALLPLVVLAGQTLAARIEDAAPGRFYSTILTGFLLGLTSLHPGVGMSAAAMLAIAFLWRLTTSRRKKALVAAFLGLGAVAVAMNIHFMAPFVGDYFGKGAIRHGWGLSVSAEGDVTVDTELPRREAYHESTSQPGDASAFLRLRPGMDTEYVYPIPEGLGLPWHLAALLVSLGVFAYPFRTRKTPELTALFVTALAGVLLVAGSRTLPGMVFYQLGLKKTLPILFAAFSNTTRWLPLAVLPYAILFARAAADAAECWRPRAAMAGAGVAALVFVSPFLAGGLTRPFDPDRDIQPLTLKQTPIAPEDAAVYSFLRDRRDAFRVAYLPPIGITWPGDTDYTFEWTSAYSPKPFFMAFKTHPLSEPIFAGLYAEHPNTRVARLMGLGSCRFLVYPHYEHAYTYEDYQPSYAAPAVDGYKDYKPVFDANLAMQEGLVKRPLFSSVDLLENEEFLPLVRPGDRVAAVESVGTFRGGNPVAAALAEEVLLPGYDPATVYLRAGSDPVFLEFLTAIMGDGGRTTRLLADRRADRKLLVSRPDAGVTPPTVEFRRLGPTAVRVRVHGARAGFPLVFQETFHTGWKALVVPRPAGELTGDAGAMGALLAAYAPFPIQGTDAAGPRELADYAGRGLISTLGRGQNTVRHGFLYGPGGRVTGETSQTFAVDYVSALRAGSVQNDNLPPEDLTEALFPGRFQARTPEAASRPLKADGWTITGNSGNAAPVALPDALHVEAYGYANAWWVAPQLFSLLPPADAGKPGYFVRRPDGGLDFELLLSFAPQTSYRIGLAVSAAAMAGCLGVLLVGPFLGKRRETLHE